MIEYNPLDILGQRESNYIPPHFAKIKLHAENPWHDNFNDIKLWVSNKLKGRYSICKLPSIGIDGKMKSVPFIGFEDHKELTYFMLACPYIRR